MQSNNLYYLVSPLAEIGHSLSFLTYRSSVRIASGSIIKIPFGSRYCLGVVISSAKKPNFNTKAIDEILDLKPLPRHILKLAKWMHSYYVTSYKQIWQTILPSSFTVNRKIINHNTKIQSSINKTTIKLTMDQKNAIKVIQSNLSEKPYLIWGVAGSGKTEVYIELAKQNLKNNKSAIILVPEIALTAQMVDRFNKTFRGQIIINHSLLSNSQRRQNWLNILNSQKPFIIIGPRSSLFMPLDNLGLIVIDESHDSSYKQEQNPKYNATAVATKLTHFTNAKLIFGSATPSVVDMYLAKRKVINLIKLTQPIYSTSTPVVEIINIKDRNLFKQSNILSTNLIIAIRKTLASHRQSLLFINRRGNASSQVCNNCSYVIKCPNCKLPLTWHSNILMLICHWCNYKKFGPGICPSCKKNNWRFTGIGTQRIEIEAQRLFPEAHILRIDKDNINLKNIHNIINNLYTGKIDIIIGTQMIAKGFDFPLLDTVGIVLADNMLYLPDYGAAERTFNILLQASGRAGRRNQPAKVFIQTLTPNHPAIMAAANKTFIKFYTKELADRKALGYPPFCYLIKLICAKKIAKNAINNAYNLAKKLSHNKNLHILGPAPAFHEYKNKKFYWQIVIKSNKREDLVNIAQNLPAGWTSDLDPVNLL